LANVAALMNLLGDNQWHSGASLGDSLGVSRNAIWKQMASLEELGLVIERSRLKGYRLKSPVDLIDEQALKDVVAKSDLFEGVDYFEVIDSTNDQLLNRMANGVAPWVSVAEQQTSGRGRRGRHWVSPYGQNLYMSFSWPVEGGIASLQGLSLAVGVVVAEVLTELGVKGVGLKWPNDLLGANGKLGGILIDVTGDPQGDLVAVVGMGVNLVLQESELTAIGQPATGVRGMGLSCTRTELASRFVVGMASLFKGYEREGFECYQQRFTSMDMFKGSGVKMMLGEQVILGEALGVDNLGQYLVKREDTNEIQAFSGGEVSLRCQ